MTKPDCYDYVRNYYNVPAKVGGRVRAYGKEGVIVRANTALQYIHVKFDGQRHSVPCHPTDGVEYLGVAEVAK